MLCYSVVMVLGYSPDRWDHQWDTSASAWGPHPSKTWRSVFNLVLCWPISVVIHLYFNPTFRIYKLILEFMN